MALPPTTRSPAKPKHVAKTFNVSVQDNKSSGQKIVMYGKSGIGKSTLAAMAPDAIFIDVDNGISGMVHPATGEALKHIAGIETYQDLRDALAQSALFPTGSTVIIDTITRVEPMAERHVLENVTKDGKLMTSIKQFGWGDGDYHTLDAMRLILTDLDRLVRNGVNVILLAQLEQATISNAEGADYLEDGPKLLNRRNCSIRTTVVEWADQVFRIGYSDLTVFKDSDTARAGKVVDGDAERAVFAGGAQHFIAKSRPINGEKLPPIMRFAAEKDNAAWCYVFGQDCFYTGDSDG